jgi:RNA polymerase sigma factor (sigma-70 family)
MSSKRRHREATRRGAGKTPVAAAESEAGALARLVACIAARGEHAEPALRELHDQTAGAMMGLARTILRDKSDAEEIVCDTYVQVWQTAGSFDAGRASPMGWLAMICRSRALDRIREHKLRAKLAADVSAEPVDVVDEGPERLISMLQTDSSVHAALAKLSADKRRLVELAFLEGLSHATLSERLQVPLGSVKSALRRSLRTLHESLEGHA